MQAYFIALANDEEIQTGWYDQKEKSYRFVPYLPSYQELLESVNPGCKKS